MLSQLHKAIPTEFTLTHERRKHILEHPEMKGQIKRIYETLRLPDVVRKSLRSDDILIFYKWYTNSPVTEKFMAVVVKLVNGKGLILTAYYTNRLKPGESIWEKQEVK
ncbi:MAG: hypothetical protein QXH58_01010 [Nitrososphaerales archaeon]